jgi:Tfp pilus assembly protein PilZ
MYKLFNDSKTGELSSVFNTKTNTSIPLNPANTDYQAYLKYIEQGGLVLPADAGAEEVQQ